MFINALDLGLTLPTTTGPPQTTRPPPSTTRATTQRPTTRAPQPSTTCTGFLFCNIIISYNYRNVTSKRDNSDRLTTHPPYIPSTRAPFPTSRRYTTGPSYTLSSPFGRKKREMEHCPTEVHKICESNTRSM